MPEARKLQGWLTISGPDSETLVQDEDGWLDLSDYDDVAVWVQVPNASNVQGLDFQTSPVRDGDMFVTMTSWTSGGTLDPRVYSLPFATATTPLARYVRWRARGRPGGSMSITFRAWIVAFSHRMPPLMAMLAPSEVTEASEMTGGDAGAFEAPERDVDDSEDEDGADEDDKRAWRAWRPPIIFAGPNTLHVPGMPPVTDLSKALTDELRVNRPAKER